MLRLATSINWAVGTLILGGALLFALISETVFTGGTRSAAKVAVDSIAKAERDHYARRETYVYFPSDEPLFSKAVVRLGLGTLPDDFRFEAFSNAENALVIRAVTDIVAVRGGGIPPLMYEYKIKSETETGKGGWVSLSGAGRS